MQVAQPQQPLVETRGLFKRYPGILALDDVDFSLQPGEIVGLVGKNGAGKSSLIKVIAGVEQPDAGTLLIDGEPVESGYAPHLAHRHGLAFVHQELGNFPLLTVAENVAIGTRFPRRLGAFVDDRALHRRVRLVLEQLQSPLDPGAHLQRLTSVEQRLVMIARALYHDARVLVLDEPSVSLTIEEITHLHAVLHRFKELGRTVLYVSHRLQEVVSLTDRVVVMQGGKVILEQATSSIDEQTLVGAIAGSAAIPESRRAGRRMEPNERPVMQVRHLSRRPAVVDISFDLYAGEILGIAGLVGSGRTELARLIAGADRATGGSLELDGRPMTFRTPVDAVKRGIVLLPEDRRHEGLVLDFTVRENITLTALGELRHHPLLPIPSRAKENARAHAMIEKLSISTSGTEQRARRLSGGNQQKVVLAKWLQRSDRVLVFDEPSQGIDVGAKAEIFGLIDELASEGRGVIVISSDFAELAAVCTRVIGIREGRLTGAAEGDALTETELVRLAYAPHGSVEEQLFAAVESVSA